METWVIPYVDQSIDFWEEIQHRFGKDIHSVYFPLPGGLVPSGRGKLPEGHLKEFLSGSALGKSVLINPIILNRPAESLAPALLDALRRLMGDYGVMHVTVSNLVLARIIKAAIPELTLTASTLMGISTPAQAFMARDCIDTIVPDTRILRDLGALRALREAFPGEIRLIVNESCLAGCLYRTQHFYEMAYSEFYPQSLCRSLVVKHPWLRLTGGWILPQYLHFYDGLYDSLKLAGRVTLRDPQKYLRVLGAYLAREKLLPNEIGGGPASVLEPYDVPPDQFLRMLNCDKNCMACTDCKAFHEMAIQGGVKAQAA